MMDIYWHRMGTSISRLDFYPEKWKQRVPLKCWICTRLNVVTFYETLLFVLKIDICIAVNHSTFCHTCHILWSYWTFLGMMTWAWPAVIMSINFIVWYIVLKSDECIAVNHNILYESRQHMLHVLVILTILRHDEASLTICKNFGRIHPVVVYMGWSKIFWTDAAIYTAVVVVRSTGRW
jgi:hypothetical protein